MNHQTRAALVAMGQDMARAREVLAVTERRSLRHVYEQEFRLTHVGKSPKSPKEPSGAKPEKPWKPTNISNAATKIIEQIDAGQIDEVPSGPKIAEEFNIHRREGAFAAGMVLAILNDRETRDPVVISDLPESDQNKIDRAIKQELKKLQDGFHEAVKKEVRQHIDRMHSDWKRKIEFAEKYGGGALSMQREKFPLTRKQFKELLFFTHPDRQDESLKQRAADIFSAVKAKEDSLVMPEPPTGGPPFPSSPDDLLRAARKTK